MTLHASCENPDHSRNLFIAAVPDVIASEKGRFKAVCRALTYCVATVAYYPAEGS